VRWPPVLAATAVAGLTLVAVAQKRPVLHEYVAPPSASEAGSRIVSRAPEAGLGETGGSPANPSAIRHAGRILAAPPVDAPQDIEEPRHGDQLDRQTSAHPDRNTSSDGQLHYSEVFNPSVVPFKRMSALDEVASDYGLLVHEGPLETVPVGGDASPDRDLFWGSLVLDFTAERRIPIPSVAPEMRVLSYETQPPVALEFLRDGADNYLVAVNERGIGTVRLVFLVDAPATYFAPKLPGSVRLGELSRLVPPELSPVSRLSRRARDAADQILKKLRIERETPLDVAVDRLVAYFRAFEAGPTPELSDDIYLDLADSQKGVCRHRAFAFLVTALAAGIPTRYVTNEAHAFVEVWLPGGQGWARVDLGGAALELDVANAADKQMYRPRGEDPFAKPPEYANNYTQLSGDIRGLSAAQRAEAGKPLPEIAASSPGATRPNPAPVTGLPRHAEPTVDKPLVSLTVLTVAEDAYRGDKVTVTGIARSDAGIPAGIPISIYFAPGGRMREALLIGETVTAADGSFRLEMDLPSRLPIGQYAVYAFSNGNDKFSPSTSK
jgi:hypothetical protein